MSNKTKKKQDRAGPPLGSQNALKEPGTTLDASINMRVLSELKAEFVSKANDRDESLTDFILNSVDYAIKHRDIDSEGYNPATDSL